MSGPKLSGPGVNGASTGGLTWRRLELSGFGVHDGCKFEFPEGLAAYVAPNEDGKSTAVAGLTAVVFGLPGVSDKAAWGQARFRSTRGLSRFEGSVEFLALDGHVYRVWRNFATHQVRLARLEGGRYTVIFDGEHNPGARKGAPQYEAELRRLVGISSHEVFNHTFSICQPLAWGSALSDEVATLLSGSGGGSYYQALEDLAANIVDRTKYASQYGVPGRTKHNDRELEKVEAKLTWVKQAIHEGSAAAEGLQQLNGALSEAEAEEVRLKKQVDALEGKAKAAKDWLAAKDTYDREQRAHVKLQRTYEQASRLEGEIGALEGSSVLEAPPERDWGFTAEAAPTAVACVRERREDAAQALSEYGRYAKALDDLRRAEADKAKYELFNSASESVLDELAHYENRLSSLNRECEDAEERLNDLRTKANSLDTSYEDVAHLPASQVTALRQKAQQEPAKPRFPLAWVLGGLILGILLGALTPLSIVLGALFAIIGFVVGRGRAQPAQDDGEREAAARTVARYDEWCARRDAAQSYLDLEPYETRQNEAEAAIQRFHARMDPFRRAYGDVTQAFQAYREVNASVTASSERAAEEARNSWKAKTGEVERLDPTRLSSHWQRLATFAHALSLKAATIAQLVASLKELEDVETWTELSADATRWDTHETQRRQRGQEARSKRDQLAGILQGESVTAAEDLAQKVSDHQTRAMLALQKFQDISEAHPELPRWDDPEADRAKLADAQRDLEAQHGEARKRLGELQARLQTMYRDRSSIEGKNPENIAAREVEVQELEAQKAELEAEINTYALAYKTMTEAVYEYKDSYIERLSEGATARFDEFTGGTGRHVIFDKDFRVRVVEPDGVTLDPAQLSQGAQDQLALAIRLAIADMISGDLPLPLVLDDPFHNCDRERLGRIEATIKRIAETRQVLLLSHDEQYLDWGDAVTVQAEVRAG